MQPKHLPKHLRIKYEPTQKQKGVGCRLFGEDFRSIAEAARHYNITYSWAHQMVTNGRHRDTPRDAIRKTWKKAS